jgi:hypothetical protein
VYGILVPNHPKYGAEIKMKRLNKLLIFLTLLSASASDKPRHINPVGIPSVSTMAPGIALGIASPVTTPAISDENIYKQ